MRLDKYLKVARILKRRTVSKELAANLRVLINGKIAKPATEVIPGDIIEVTFGRRVIKISVNEVKYNVRKNDADMLYPVLEEYTLPEEENDQQAL